MLINRYYISVVGIVYGYDLFTALTEGDTSYKRLRLYASSLVYDWDDIDMMIEALKIDIIDRCSYQCVGSVNHFRVHITTY